MAKNHLNPVHYLPSIKESMNIHSSAAAQKEIVCTLCVKNLGRIHRPSDEAVGNITKMIKNWLVVIDHASRSYTSVYHFA